MKENADIVGNILYEIINSDICNSYFPEKLKLAEISLLQKDSDVMNKTKYRPVSILPSISKIYERVMQSQLLLLRIICIFTCVDIEKDTAPNTLC